MYTYIYIYICAHTHTHTYIHTHIHTNTLHVCRSQFLHVFGSSPDETAFFRIYLLTENVTNMTLMIQVCICMYTHINTYIHTCICVYMYVCICQLRT